MFFIYKVQCHPRFINQILHQEYLDLSGSCFIFSMCFFLYARRESLFVSNVSPQLGDFWTQKEADTNHQSRCSCSSSLPFTQHSVDQLENNLFESLRLTVIYSLSLIFQRVPGSSTSDPHWKQTASERDGILMLCLLSATVGELCQHCSLIPQLMQAQHSAVHGSFNLILTSFFPWLSSQDKSQGRKREKRRKPKERTSWAWYSIIKKFALITRAVILDSAKYKSVMNVLRGRSLLNPALLHTPSARSSFFNSGHLSMAIINFDPRKRIPWEASEWRTSMPVLQMDGRQIINCQEQKVGNPFCQKKEKKKMMMMTIIYWCLKSQPLR